MKNKKLIIILVCAILVVGAAIAVVMIWGDDISNAMAGEELIECKMSNDYEGEAKIETNYIIHSNKKTNTVNKVESTQVIETDNKTMIDHYSEQFEEQYKNADKEYGGFDYKLDVKDNKLTFNLTINYRKVDMDKFVSKFDDFKSLLDDENQIKTEELKAFYEGKGYGCNTKEK